MVSSSFAVEQARLAEARQLPGPCHDDFLRLSRTLIHGPPFQWLLGARRAFLQTQPLSFQALLEGFQRCFLLWPEKALLSGGIPIRQLPALLDAT